MFHMLTVSTHFTTDKSQQKQQQFYSFSSFPSYIPLSDVQWENWALACPARILNLGWNGVGAVLRHTCRCSLVSLEQYLVLIMFIGKKANSQLYLEPNTIKMYGATIWSQKVSVSVLPNYCFRGTSAWRFVICIWSGPVFSPLRCSVTPLRTQWHLWFFSGGYVHHTMANFYITPWTQNTL